MPLTWLLRMAKWARHPPSPRHVALVLGVIAICLLLAGMEYLVGWPDALTPNPGGAPKVRVPAN